MTTSTPHRAFTPLVTSESLTGRTAAVTGAASGIGAATARLLAASGARVAVLSRRVSRLAALSDEIRATGGHALPVAMDVIDAANVDAAAARIAAELGRVNLIVNNAGVMLPAPIEERRDGDWQVMIDTNLAGVLRVIRAFVPDLLAAAAEGLPADLVNVSSIGARIPFPRYAVYSATKAAVSMLSQSLRTELGPRDVRVTTIEPGLTSTELDSHVTDPGARDQLAQMFGTLGGIAATDVAELVAFAVSRPRNVNLSDATILPTRQA